MIEISLKFKEVYVADSGIIKTTVGKKYRVVSEYVGIEGSPNNAYFGVESKSLV